MVLEPFLATPEDAVWWAMVSIPAIFGALTVFPVAAIARDHVSKPAAVIAAWLIAMMPGHISRSTWANADHDAFVMFFMALGFMWFLRAMAAGGDERLTRTTDARPSTVLRAFGDVATTVASPWSTRPWPVSPSAWSPSVGRVSWSRLDPLRGLRLHRRDQHVPQQGQHHAQHADADHAGNDVAPGMPFYAYPGMDLVFSGTGLQPLLFVLGFTMAIAYVTTGFRDKPGCSFWVPSPALPWPSWASFGCSNSSSNPTPSTSCSPVQATSPRPRFSARLQKPTRLTAGCSSRPSVQSCSSSRSAWASSPFGEAPGNAATSTSSWPPGSFRHLHVVDRCAFHLQRHTGHGRARRLGCSGLWSWSGTKGNDAQDASDGCSNTGRPYCLGAQGRVAHATIQRDHARHDHALAAST